MRPPGRTPSRPSAAIAALLGEVVDYAGLFPPAQLAMDQAVRNYAAYLNGPHHPFLGRFILPLGRLPEFSAAYQQLHATEQTGWRLSVIAGEDSAANEKALREFKTAHPGAPIAAVEFRFARGVTAPAALRSAGDREGWVEFSPADSSFRDVLSQLKSHGLGAKLRTGGTTPEAFPPARRVAEFLAACREAGVVAKATAGLHHPVSGLHPLTYEAASPRSVMFGFLNLFLAAAWINRGASADDATALLEDREPANFSCQPDCLTWRQQRFTTTELVTMRRTLLRSFGSCSFAEPIEGLQDLGWL